MKMKTTKIQTKKSPAKKPEAPPPSLGLDDLKALAVKTGILAGASWAYHCNHISDLA
jgi:hypothetical protein